MMPRRKNESQTCDGVILLCPSCDKRLPLGGTLSMRGTTGIFCRHCHRTVQVTMKMLEEDSKGEMRNL